MRRKGGVEERRSGGKGGSGGTEEKGVEEWRGDRAGSRHAVKRARGFSTFLPLFLSSFPS
jgi:hypothetical protein